MTTNIFAFVVVLGVLIFFHELGHFLVARLFGVGVEKFSLGFGPRLFGRTVGMTDYRISAIPLGGYVKMVGDEPDAELETEMIPYSFTHKHVFKKILIVAAGPFFNLLLAVIIYSAFFTFIGTEDIRPVVNHVVAGSPAEQAGLKVGDLVEAVDTEKVASWSDINRLVADAGGGEVRIAIKRGDTFFDVAVTPQTKVAKDLLGDDVPFYDVGLSGLAPLKAFVGEVADGYPAKKAGLRKGDLIVAINDRPVDSWNTMKTIISQSKGEPLSVRIVRNGETLTVDIVPVLFSEENVLGEKVDSYRIGISSPGIDIPEADRITIKRGPSGGGGRRGGPDVSDLPVDPAEHRQADQRDGVHQDAGRPHHDCGNGGAAGQSRDDQPDFFHRRAEHQPGRAQFSAHSGSRWRPSDVFLYRGGHRAPHQHPDARDCPAGRYIYSDYADDFCVL